MIVSDYRWAVALEALQQWNDPRDLIKAMVAIGFDKPPEWVREELALWSKGELPPDAPPLLAEDKELLRAAAMYRRLDKTESRDQRIECAARESSVSEQSLRNYLDGKGRPYARIRKFYWWASRRQDPTA